MSGDAQPRKRRDKRRRKGQVEARRAEEYAEEREILHQLSTQSEPEEEELYPNLKDTDEVIHIHKDAHTGGNIVTKIIFFLLMGGLAVMIGLILLEHRGTTDDDREASVKETPWSLQFEDWSKLVAVPDIVPEFFKGEQTDHDHHASHSGEETDDHAGDHDEHDEGHDDEHDEHDEGHDEPVAESSWLPSFSLGGWGGSTDDAEAAEPEEALEPEASNSWFSLDYFGGGEEKPEEAVEEEAPESKEIEGAELSEEEEGPDEEEAPEDEDEGDEEAEDAAEEDEEENLSAERDLDEEEPPSGEQFDEDDEPDRSVIDEEIPQSEEIEQDEPVSGEGEEDDDPRGSVFPRRSSIIEEVEEEDEQDEEETEASSKIEEEEEEPAPLPETSEEELFPEAVEALQREALELLRERREAEEKKAAAAAVESTSEALEDEDEPEAIETGDEETEGMALKFGVGVALVVVAHVVLVKKWNSWAVEQGAQTQASSPVSSPTVQISPPTPPTPKATPDPPLAAWAEEAIKAAEAPVVGRTPPRTPTPDLGDEYEGESEPGEDEEEEEEEEEELSEDEPPINPKIYEELIAKYGKPTPESSDAEASDDGRREYSDGAEVESVGEEESGGELEESEPEEEQRWPSSRKPVEVETESEGEEEEESEDEPPPARKPPQGGARSENEPTSPTEEDLLRRQLELADDEFNMEEYYF